MVNRLWLGGVFVLLLLWDSAYGKALSKVQVVLDKSRSMKGSICFTVFNQEDGFPDEADKALDEGCIGIERLPVVLDFELPQGYYALAVLHDENNDGEMNKGPFGMPKEGFGFSNNPELKWGAPSFEECKFLVKADLTDIKVDLKYM